MIKKICALVFLSVLSITVLAQDIYDGYTLKIPKVSVGDILYRDVQITVGQILAVNGGVPIQEFDKYEPTTNVLNIPSVLVGGSTYTNVQITVGQILSVGDSGPLDPMKWLITSVKPAGQILISTYVPNLNGDYDIVATGDLNGDGFDDIVLGPKVWDSTATYDSTTGNWTVHPEILNKYQKLIIAFYNPKSGNFEPDPVVQNRMPVMQWAHKALIGDFNKDGFNDLLVVGTGPDQGQGCGEASVLMLGSAAGIYDASHFLPRLSSYTHQMAVADLNGDGKQDFIFLNNQYVPWSETDPKIAACSYRRYLGTNNSYVILSNNTGWTYQTLEVHSTELGPIVTTDRNQHGGSYSSLGTIDFDQDGNVDLVIYGGNFGSIPFKAVVLKGDGRGGFSYHSSFEAKPFGNLSVSAAIVSRDLDGDNKPELVLNFAAADPSKPGWQGSLYKVFKLNSSTKTWSDVSSAYFPSTYNLVDTDLVYCDAMIWFDINRDGRDDLVCSAPAPIWYDDPSSISPRVWLQEKSGKFVPAFHKDVSVKWAFGNIRPIYLGKKVYLVGLWVENGYLKFKLAN